MCVFFCCCWSIQCCPLEKGLQKGPNVRVRWIWLEACYGQVEKDNTHEDSGHVAARECLPSGWRTTTTRQGGERERHGPLYDRHVTVCAVFTFFVGEEKWSLVIDEKETLVYKMAVNIAIALRWTLKPIGVWNIHLRSHFIILSILVKRGGNIDRPFMSWLTSTRRWINNLHVHCVCVGGCAGGGGKWVVMEMDIRRHKVFVVDHRKWSNDRLPHIQTLANWFNV